MKPGIHELENDAYHAVDGYSSTNIIDVLSYSEAHMKYWKANQAKTTPSMIEGTMLHESILEPKLFDSKYYVADGRTKEGKAMIEANEGKVKCTDTTYNKVIAMRDSILRSIDINQYMNGAMVEKSFFWNDVDTGLLCKCKPDILNVKAQTIFDIKTIDSGALWNVKNAIRSYSYHVSAAFYMTGINMILGADSVKDFALIFIEKEAPHGVRKIILSLNDLQIGFNEYKNALSRIKKANDTNVWPSYPNEFIEMNVFGINQEMNHE